MNRISVIGSLNMDLVFQTDRLPLAGETIAGKNFNLIPGGKGANQALAAAKAGAETRLFGCVGEDEFGDVLLKSLLEAKVDISHIKKVTAVHSGVASIILEGSGENRIIVIPGANDLVDADYIDKHWESIQNSALLILQHEIPIQTCQYVIQRASESSVPVLLNPAPFHSISDEILRKVDYLVLNETELHGLLHRKITSIDDVLEAGKLINQKGVKHVLITLGSDGAVLVTDDEWFHHPAYSVEVVDTTAAGDTFVGNFASAIIKGYELNRAIKIASAAAALAVTKIGAQSSIPCSEETQLFIENHIFEGVR